MTLFVSFGGSGYRDDFCHETSKVRLSNRKEGWESKEVTETVNIRYKRSL